MQTRSILRWCTRHDLPQLSHCPVVGTAVYLRTGLVCKLLPSSLEFLTSFSEDHFGFSPDGIERNFISVFKDHFVLLCLCVCCWGSGKWVVCLFFFYLAFLKLFLPSMDRTTVTVFPVLFSRVTTFVEAEETDVRPLRFMIIHFLRTGQWFSAEFLLSVSINNSQLGYIRVTTCVYLFIIFILGGFCQHWIWLIICVIHHGQNNKGEGAVCEKFCESISDSIALSRVFVDSWYQNIFIPLAWSLYEIR